MIAGGGSVLPDMHKNIDDLKRVRLVDRLFTPNADPLRSQKLQGWQRAIKAVQIFAHYEP